LGAGLKAVLSSKGPAEAEQATGYGMMVRHSFLGTWVYRSKRDLDV
jgi:hypothetical protein